MAIAIVWMSWNLIKDVRHVLHSMAIVSKYKIIYCEYMMVTGEYIAIIMRLDNKVQQDPIE